MSGWLRGRCRRVLTTAGAELAPGLERRRRQLVLVLDSGVCGRTLPVLVILQGPVVATLGAFYGARAGSRALQGSGNSCYFLRRSHDDHTRKHDEHSLVQGHTLVQCLVVAILDLLCGCKHEDHARGRSEPGQGERRQGRAVGRRGTAPAWCVFAQPGPLLSRRSGSLPRPMPHVAACR